MVCNTTLFPDAKVLKYIPKHLVRSNLSANYLCKME